MCLLKKHGENSEQPCKKQFEKEYKPYGIKIAAESIGPSARRR